jgi:2-iminobutanoate/2-iminopropanoate deaminase
MTPNQPVSIPIMPNQIGPPAANYVHAMLSTSPRRWLHTSGVVPVAPDGSVPADIGAQAEVVWSNILAMLAEAGMSPTAVVSVTTYAVTGQPLGEVMNQRDRALGEHQATSTLVTVPQLARPEWLMEIAIVACD